MVGVDPSPVARAAAAETLRAAGIAHQILDGDVAEPEAIAQKLCDLGLDPAGALHVSKSVFHNRTFKPPRGPAGRPAGAPASTGAFAGPNGWVIPNCARRAGLARAPRPLEGRRARHGLVVIEAHTTPPETAARLAGRTVATALDAAHGYSHQLLLEPEVFADIARRAGLASLAHREPGAATVGHTVLTIDHFVADC